MSNTINSNAAPLTVKSFLNGGIEKECSAYDAVLAVTERETRHLAVDTTPSFARQGQRQFANWVNRLVKLLARDFPGAAVSIRFLNAAACCRDAVRYDSHKTLAVLVWVTDEKRVLREFTAVHGLGKSASVYVGTRHYQHRGSDAFSGVEAVKYCSAHHTTACAAKLIRDTPMHTFSAE